LSIFSPGKIRQCAPTPSKGGLVEEEAVSDGGSSCYEAADENVNTVSMNIRSINNSR